MNTEETKTEQPEGLDLAAIRAKLAGQSGQRYWRSLEEVADTPEFQKWMEDEFPNRSTLGQIDRRSLLKFMGASIALAGLSGCRGYFLPQDKVVPYVRQPEELIPGKPLFYASAMTLGGYATGVLVEQHMGRPTRIEGNPQHPASLGALDPISQAEVLGLYDPDRTTTVKHQGDTSTWDLFDSAMREAFASQTAARGAGIRILTGASTSPTLVATMDRFLAKFPAARWHVHEPAGLDNVHAGATVAFGRALDVVYDFAKAKVVVSLDSDFVNPVEIPGAFAHARQFASGRTVRGKTGTMNRVYSLESTPGLVGAVADHRYAMRPSEVAAAAHRLAEGLGIPVSADLSGAGDSAFAKDLGAIVRDLRANPGETVVVAGKHLPPAVHALVHKINEVLGNFGKTVRHIAPVEATVRPGIGDLRTLVADLNADRVGLLIVLDANPVYTAPADLAFAEAFAKAKVKVHAGLIQDETGLVSDWHLPLTHALEAWGDARAFDGTASVVQPLIAPLFEGKSVIEIVSRLSGKQVSGYDLVRQTWKSSGLGGADFEAFWRKALHDGLIANTASKPATVSTRPTEFAGTPKTEGLEISFRTDPTVYDGRFANNGWLQELPKPLTKLTWDNAVIVSVATGERLGLQSEDLVTVEHAGRKVEGAVSLVPGQPDDLVTVHFGYGRTAGGTVATAYMDNPGATSRRWEEGGGFSAFALRTTAHPDFAGDVTIQKVGGTRELASTQGHNPLNDSRIIDDRDIVRDFTLASFQANVDEWLKEWEHKSEEYDKADLYPEKVFESNLPQWGMTIDMNTCIGCNACVTACQSENNIPVVGKVQVKRHREMHWLRIDRYYRGSDANPEVTWQPMMCVHCEKAPCEPVCPVAATIHSHEGLNMMVYNRCVGTRYCSNNCPYKVRRFNYLNWTDNQPNFATKTVLMDERKVPGPIHTPKTLGREMLKMVSNPDVTVRGRGVMEKCTYCVQRINNARIEAKKAGREIADGDILTACQQACPTNTIVFGNVADESSKVSALRRDPRAYLLLEELLTRPRTSHLAKLRNPNPEIEGAKA